LSNYERTGNDTIVRDEDREDDSGPRCEECGAELQAPARFCPECSQARYEAAPDIRANDGQAWEKFQRRMAAVKPLTKAQIEKYQKYAAY